MTIARVYLIITSLFFFFAASINATVIHNPQIIAHRAGTADAAENTIPAIDKSIKNEVDAV